MKYTIALAQFHIQPGELQTNLRRGLEMIESAGKANCSLVLLPELWSSGYDLEHAGQHSAATPEILAELRLLAGRYQMIIAGSLLSTRSMRPQNTLFWQAPGAAEPREYSKIHLFSRMEEPLWLLPGEQLAQINAPWGATGLAICYDLRFPELFRSYALRGAEAFALSAEWPVRRIAHWQVLLRARAIENQAFMFAVNCVGKSGNDTFGGCSAVISPWGEVLVDGGADEEALLTASIDPRQVAEARSFLPVFADRRPNLYALDRSLFDE